MSYFNHSFCKVMWAGGTGYTNTPAEQSVSLHPTYGPGAVTFADQDAAGWPSVSVAPTDGKPLTLLATSLYSQDKIGGFHGGYLETNKSKMINPALVTKFYRVDSSPAVTNIIGVGATPNLDLAGADANCCPAFFCDENYHLRFDLKGSPALRLLNHNAYEVAAAYTGCCDGPVPELVDPSLVMQEWMNYVVLDPILSGPNHAPNFTPQTDQRLVNIGYTVTTDNGATWDLFLPDNLQVGVAGVYFEADGTTLNAAGIAFRDAVQTASGVVFGATAPSSTYVSVFTPATPNVCAGLVLQSAFVETQFGTCTFQCTDHFEVEPLSIQASMLDETGDPCVFDQLCISDGITPSGTGSQTVYPAIQQAVQLMGSGEQVLRDLILSERYQQNHFGSGDLRIREIHQGDDILALVNRNTLYTCYFIEHIVPRTQNASSQFDNDRYLIKIPMTGVDANLEAFMATWLTSVNNPVALQTY